MGRGHSRVSLGISTTRPGPDTLLSKGAARPWGVHQLPSWTPSSCPHPWTWVTPGSDSSDHLSAFWVFQTWPTSMGLLSPRVLVPFLGRAHSHPLPSQVPGCPFPHLFSHCRNLTFEEGPILTPPFKMQILLPAPRNLFIYIFFPIY